MKFKEIKLILLAVFMFNSFASYAGLIDFKYDNVSEIISYTGGDADLYNTQWKKFTTLSSFGNDFDEIRNSIAALLAANDGWKIAGTKELSALASNIFGTPTVSSLFGIPSYFYAQPDNSLMLEMKSLFGATGLDSLIFSGFGINHLQNEFVTALRLTERYSYFNGVTNITINQDVALNEIAYASFTGQFALVRTVPEPTSFAIFLIGLLGLKLRKFSK